MINTEFTPTSSFDMALPLHHEECHAALFAAAWARTERARSHAVRRPAIKVPAWSRVKPVLGRLSVARRTRACRGIVAAAA